MFRKFVCIYLIVYSSIGSNGPFPLPKYCALPIASLDFIVGYKDTKVIIILLSSQ